MSELWDIILFLLFAAVPIIAIGVPVTLLFSLITNYRRLREDDVSSELRISIRRKVIIEAIALIAVVGCYIALGFVIQSEFAYM